MLFIYNTLSGTQEQLRPLHENSITLYVCGITPYDYAHIGHARVYVTFDVLYRLLKFYGYRVMYCRNFTDIEDKIIKKAHELYGDRLRYADITQEYIRSFHQDMDALNCLRPTYEPHVTDNIPEIIAFIQKLIDNNKAYVVDGDVYFEIQSFPDYGRLSKRTLEDMHAGARVQINEKKRYPGDFALWKAENERTFWKSPWGYGRPGWHIECSALAEKYLGAQIDIHAGGLDLVFPHHENEIAQSEGAHGVPLANYWMHNGFVQVNQVKMSKSLGNFFTLRDVFKQFHPHVIRFYLLSHHYRAPLEFSHGDILSAQKAYQRLCRAFETTPCDHTITDAMIKESTIVQHMLEYINDDLNIQGALGLIFEQLTTVVSSAQACAIKTFIQHVLGLPLEPIIQEPIVITDQAAALIEARNQARANKDWKRADELRNQLRDMGIEVHDKKT